MEVFFVRHGQTDGNLAHRHQLDETPLTFDGETQAKVLAEEVKVLAPSYIITSPLIRALDTAKIVAAACDLIPHTSTLFAELDRPQALDANYHTTLRSFWYYWRWYSGSFTGAEHGGESYKELRERIVAAKEYLETFPPEARLVVISHSVFINLFTAHVCNNEPLRPLAAYVFMQRVLATENASMTKMTYDPSAKGGTCAWRLEN